MIKVISILLIGFLSGCVLVNKNYKCKNYVEILGSDLIINKKPLGTHEEKFKILINLRNYSCDTAGIVLSNFKTHFTIPNTPIKLPCEPNENEIGFYLEKDDLKLSLFTRRSSDLILYPNSDTILYFIIFPLSESDLDEEELREISDEGTVIYQSPCESVFQDYFSSNIKWIKDIRVVN